MTELEKKLYEALMVAFDTLEEVAEEAERCFFCVSDEVDKIKILLEERGGVNDKRTLEDVN